MLNRQQFYGWWYLAISVGFLLLTVRSVMLGGKLWLNVVRMMIAGGFLLLSWLQFQAGKRG